MSDTGDLYAAVGVRRDMLADSHIQATRNAVEVCGSMTGHVVRPIAYCDDPSTALLLAHALKAYVTKDHTHDR